MATMETAIAGYLLLRHTKEEVRKRHQEELAPINDKMAKIEAWLMRELNKEGAQSTKTTAGTVFLSTISKPQVVDANAFTTFVQDQNLIHLLDVRADKTAIEEYKEARGELPPGITITTETFARVRKQ